LYFENIKFIILLSLLLMMVDFRFIFVFNNHCKNLNHKKKLWSQPWAKYCFLKIIQIKFVHLIWIKWLKLSMKIIQILLQYLSKLNDLILKVKKFFSLFFYYFIFNRSSICTTSITLDTNDKNHGIEYFLVDEIIQSNGVCYFNA